MSLLDAFLLDPVRVTVWIADRRKTSVVTDGGLGAGTEEDPFDGSGGRLDALLASFGPNTCVRLGPGTFETAGYYENPAGNPIGWQPKPGWRILGSGMDVTFIKLVNKAATTQHIYAIGHKLGSSDLKDVGNLRPSGEKQHL